LCRAQHFFTTKGSSFAEVGVDTAENEPIFGQIQ
jgi:hypothetical protein